jgi:hypothetical protein
METAPTTLVEEQSAKIRQIVDTMYNSQSNTSLRQTSQANLFLAAPNSVSTHLLSHLCVSLVGI